jgi:chromosome segregation ATPase
VSSLNEALTSAKKEIESQGIRLRDLETLLNEERRAREDAEERAARLERETSNEQEDAETVMDDDDTHETEADETKQKELTGLENGLASSSADETTSRLQQRLELMMSEMKEMKQQMERYRERAESAEADRNTLAEMIENIRKDNAKTASKEARRRSRSNSASARSSMKTGIDVADGHEAEEGEITIIREKHLEEDGPDTSFPETSHQNGHTVEQDGPKPAEESNSLVAQQPGRDAMYYGGPVGAMVTVVAIGVAVMAMLNQYPKAER